MQTTQATECVFLALSTLKGQIEDIHDSIVADILAKNTIPLPVKPAARAVIKIQVSLSAINVGTDANHPKFVIDELSRLKSLALSIEQTIRYINDVMQDNRRDAP